MPGSIAWFNVPVRYALIAANVAVFVIEITQNSSAVCVRQVVASSVDQRANRKSEIVAMRRGSASGIARCCLVRTTSPSNLCASCAEVISVTLDGLPAGLRRLNCQFAVMRVPFSVHPASVSPLYDRELPDSGDHGEGLAAEEAADPFADVVFGGAHGVLT